MAITDAKSLRAFIAKSPRVLKTPSYLTQDNLLKVDGTVESSVWEIIRDVCKPISDFIAINRATHVIPLQELSSSGLTERVCNILALLLYSRFAPTNPCSHSEVAVNRLCNNLYCWGLSGIGELARRINYGEITLADFTILFTPDANLSSVFKRQLRKDPSKSKPKPKPDANPHPLLAAMKSGPARNAVWSGLQIQAPAHIAAESLTAQTLSELLFAVTPPSEPAPETPKFEGVPPLPEAQAAPAEAAPSA